MSYARIDAHIFNKVYFPCTGSDVILLSFTFSDNRDMVFFKIRVRIYALQICDFMGHIIEDLPKVNPTSPLISEMHWNDEIHIESIQGKVDLM